MYYQRPNCYGRDDILWAQIFAVIAFILSIAEGWYVAWAAGLICVVILVIVGCCCCGDLPYELATIAGVCAIIAAVGEFLAAGGLVEFNNEIPTGLLGVVDNTIHPDHLVVVAVIAGILWFLAGVVAFRSSGCGGCCYR